MLSKLNGLRTFIVAGLLVAAAAAGALGMVDYSALIGLFVHDPNTLYAITAAIGAAFALLRLVTNSSPGGANSASQSAPMSKQVDSGE